VIHRRLLAGAICLALAGSAGGAGSAAAQVDTAGRRAPPVTQDSAAQDTTPPDTMPRLLPVFAAPLPAGPLPRGTRHSFPVDSLVFSNVRTLSDLLAHIPGVYVARGGYYGQGEYVMYGGRGPAGLEIYWDGVPYLPLGRDSVYLDPARIPLAPLERVEVVVLPSQLRVYLVSARQPSTAAASEIRVLTGDAGHAGYRGGFAKRWRSGLGLSLAADWNTIDGYAQSATTAFGAVDLWMKAEYVPTPRAGASYQILSSDWHREAGALTDDLRQRRRDGIFRLFLAQRADGLGARVQLTLATATVEGDTALGARALTQRIVELSNTWRRAHAELAVRLQDDLRPWQVDGRFSWIPARRVTLAADVRHAGYGGGGSRHGSRLHLAAGVELPHGLTARGDIAWARDLQVPALPADSAQETTDLSGALRWERPWVSLEIGGARRDAFAPIGRPGALRPVGSLSATPRTDYVTAHASLRPLPGLQLAGWYFHPRIGGGGGNDFEPPYHARVSLAFASKFWRVYKSGAFTLRGEVAAESWSRGTAGRDITGGAPLILPGATFVETNVEMRIVGVTIFWIIRNNNLMRGSYVPGLDYPRQGQFYGVRWVFTN
jgi:TonB-dependent receptor-like protein